MLDTHARKYVQPGIEKVAKYLINMGLTANMVTVIAFIVGLVPPVLIYFNHPIWAVVILWISGLLDAADGTIARVANQKSQKGALMDLTFDRLVEIGLVLALALRHPESTFYLVILLATIIFSMTVFLTVGNFAKNTTKKAFLYQAGVVERTEGFFCFSLMILFPTYFVPITLIFAGLIGFTAVQRFIHGIKILD